jgi:hypothetical protein
MPMRRRAVVICLVVLGGSAIGDAVALPSCDLLRKCSGELAQAMKESGFPARVVQQYRRNSATRFERAEASHPGVCREVVSVIINNAIEMHRRGRLKRLPAACTQKALDGLGKSR